MKLIFCLQRNTNAFYKLTVSLWLSIARHSQRTQSNKFTEYVQYLNKNEKDEDDFLHKRQRFLQSETTILGVCGQACPIIQNNNFAISL